MAISWQHAIHLEVAVGGQYRLVSVNERFLRATGYRVDQVINALMESVVPGAHVELMRSRLEQVIATRQPLTFEATVELPAGIRYAEVTLIPIFDGSGPVTHILGDSRDITARRLVEMEREQLLQNAVFLSDAARLLASLDIEHALGDMARLAVPYLGDGCAIDFFGNGGPRRVVAVSLDAAGCLVKPVELAELLSTIARLNSTRVLPR